MSTANDNTAKWAVRKFGGAGLPVGFEYLSMNPNIPAGSLPLLGGVYSRTVYKDLWAWVQEQTGYLIEESAWQEKSAANEGNVPFYSTGDGSTTFRVPSLKCWVKGANGIEEVGSYLSAGLPNITGEFRFVFKDNYRLGTEGISGAFYEKDLAAETLSNLNNPVTKEGYSSVVLDASTYNPIYGNSDTVQPKSIVGMWLVKAYGTVTNVGSTDVANIAQGLTGVETRTTAVETLADENKTNIEKIKKNLGTTYKVSESVASVPYTDVHLCDLTLEEKGLYLLIGHATISIDARDSYQSLVIYSKSREQELSKQVRTSSVMGGGLCNVFLHWANKGEVVCISSYGYKDSTYNVNGTLVAIKISD